MNITNLKTQIQNNKFDSIYYFIGDEWQVMKLYINKIAKDKELLYADSVSETIDGLKKGSSIINSDKCVVIRDDKSYMNDESAWDKIESLVGSNILIIVTTSIDKRNKFYKKFKDRFVEFAKLDTETLVKYGLREITLSQQNMRTLIAMCSNDYGQLLLEIDKIKMLGGTNYDANFKQLVDKCLITYPPKDAVFEFVDAILYKQAKLAYELYEDCKKIGESTLVILSNLYNATKQTLQVQACNASNVEKETGLTSSQIWYANKRINYYRNRELIDIMKLVQSVESSIKSGLFDEEIAVDYVLMNIFDKEK